MSSHNGYTRGKRVRMPSGSEAVLRGVGFDTLLLSDRVPDFLTPYVMDIVNEGADAQLPSPKGDLEKTKEYVRFLNLVTELAFVEPRIVPNPQADDEIAIEDVHQIDKQFIMQEVLGQFTNWLKDFRPEPQQNVDSVGHEPDLSAQTVATGETEATPVS